MQTSNADVVERELGAAAARLGLSPEPAVWDRLGQLLELWGRFGRAFNLTGTTDRAGILGHVLEGLQVVALARRIGWLPGQAWLDVGSGAGFPGLVLAACLDGVVTLVEPRERRAAFLDLAVNTIRRRDCRVLRGHVEGRRWKPLRAGERLEPGGFDWASARAVFAPGVWIETGRLWVRPGGIVVAHLVAGAPVLAGEVERVDGERWAVAGVR